MVATRDPIVDPVVRDIERSLQGDLKTKHKRCTSFAASFVTTISWYSGSGRVGCASSLSMPRCRSHQFRTLQHRVGLAKRLDHRTARILADSARNCKWIAFENKEPKNTKTWQKIVSNHIFWYFPGKVDIPRLSWRSRKKPMFRSLAQLTNHWEKLSSALDSQILIKKSLLFQCVSQFPRRRRWFLVDSILFEGAEGEVRRRRRRWREFEMCGNDRSRSFRWELFGEDSYLFNRIEHKFQAIKRSSDSLLHGIFLSFRRRMKVEANVSDFKQSAHLLKASCSIRVRILLRGNMLANAYWWFPLKFPTTS